VPQIAFMNPRRIRADLLAPGGEVTFGSAFTVQPFNNFDVSMDLTGQQILDLLEEQWSDGGDNFPSFADGTNKHFGGLDIDALAAFPTADDPYTPTRPTASTCRRDRARAASDRQVACRSASASASVLGSGFGATKR
jgi:2',3'-cyclic-nucleotide 2'-phosphodiesterase (5'-nucleotidase family)